MENLHEQFVKILEENAGIILKISGAYTRTYHDREDLINDITLELWKSFTNFRGDSKVSTWMYRVALNTSLNFSKKQKRNPLSAAASDLNDLSWLSESKSESAEESDLLYHCINQLSDINKIIILLYLEENSHEEIALITGISVSNVGTRISRIREQLKNLIIKKQ